MTTEKKKRLTVFVAVGHHAVHVVSIVHGEFREVFHEDARVGPFFHFEANALVLFQQISNLWTNKVQSLIFIDNIERGF